MKYLGLDGCKAGWFLTGFNDDGFGSFGILKHISELDNYLDSAEVILIDIPVGLRTKHPDERLCDKAARAVLQPGRGSSVFPAPSRCALDSETYEDASRQNRKCTGRGLSKQTFGILPKIREVDEYLSGCEKKTIIHEMHPEICFWALNDRRPMAYNKKKKEGYEQRLDVLTKYYAGARNIIELAMTQYKRKEVARDDIVDALVGGVTAMNSSQLRRFPDTLEFDDKGLPMEIVY